jgi:hypothetical protein
MRVNPRPPTTAFKCHLSPCNLKAMRANTFLLLISLLVVPLSGCLGFGEDETHNHPECNAAAGATMPAGDGMQGNGTGDTMEDNAAPGSFQIKLMHTEDCPPAKDDGVDTGNGTVDPEGNDTVEPELPNQLPTAMLTMTADDGTVLDNFTAIKPGQTITFSAVGSSDPDGTIDLIGLTVRDTNNTRVAQLLEGGAFVNATYKFDYVGPINVTIRVLDNRGEGVVVYYDRAVNYREAKSETPPLFIPNQSGCNPASSAGGTPLIDNQFYHKEPFNVQAGAKWFSAVSTGTQRITICDKTDTQLATGTAGAAATGVDAWATGTEYYVAFFPSSANTEMNFEIIVHYEDKRAEE